MIDVEIETTPLAPQALTSITNNYPDLKTFFDLQEFNYE